MKTLLKLTVRTLAFCGLLVSTAPAATFVWDPNGATVGCGSTGNWGIGTLSGLFWGTACDTGHTRWSNTGGPHSGILNGTATYTITATNNITVNTLTLNTNITVASTGA